MSDTADFNFGAVVVDFDSGAIFASSVVDALTGFEVFADLGATDSAWKRMFRLLIKMNISFKDFLLFFSQ